MPFDLRSDLRGERLAQVVKERRMVFDTETDPETLYELFGDDAQFLGE